MPEGITETPHQHVWISHPLLPDLKQCADCDEVWLDDEEGQIDDYDYIIY